MNLLNAPMLVSATSKNTTPPSSLAAARMVSMFFSCWIRIGPRASVT